MHVEQVNQSTIRLEISMCVFACITCTSTQCGPRCFLLSTQQIPTNQNSNNVLLQPFLHVCPWYLTLCFTCVWILTSLWTLWMPRSIFTSHWPCRPSRERCKIPSATSVRLGWVKKESSLWLLSLWITPQYGITLQWMSADTIPAAQLWTIQQRFGYRAAMEYLLI